MYELIMNKKEQKHLRAELIFAKKLELIEDDTLNGVEDRRKTIKEKKCSKKARLYMEQSIFSCLPMSDMSRHVFAWILYQRVKR